MSELNNSPLRAQKKARAKKNSTHIDMTPMVDLMSLLITFFMLTTAFSKPKVMEIVLPSEGTGGEAPAPRTIHILLSGNDRVYYYYGKPPMTEKEFLESENRLLPTSYNGDGIRKVILSRNLNLYERIDSLNNEIVTGNSKLEKDSVVSLLRLFKKQDKAGPIVMIKADKTAKYRNIVDVVDEMAICNVARYAITEPNEFELRLLENAPR